jgi:hypothetical protein
MPQQEVNQNARVVAKLSSNQAMPHAVYWLTILAFALRVATRLYSGAAEFWAYGYSFFFDMAQNIAAGRGMRMGNGPLTTFRPPVYPIFLAGITLGHEAFYPIVIAQSLIGAGTVLCAALLARQIFGGSLGTRTATIAAAITAVYPWYVVHDTALEETSLFTLLTLLASILVLRAARTRSLWFGALGGSVLGLDVLTRAAIVPFAVLVPLWLIWQKRTKSALICALLMALTVSPWLWRSYRLTGSIMLDGDSGQAFWSANNDWFFNVYPQGDHDTSMYTAMEALSQRDQLELRQIGGNEAAQSHWFYEKAFAYIRSHPWLTFTNGLRKVGAGFSWLPSPRRSVGWELVNALSYGPVMLLGVWGMWMHRLHWREDSLIYAQFAVFVLVTAAYWAHTRHRIYLDVYWIVFAAGVLAVVPAALINERTVGALAKKLLKAEG